MTDKSSAPRARGRNAGRDLARGACTATGHKRRTLLMLGKYGFNTGMIEAVVHRQDMGTGHTEDILDTELLHVFNDQFADWDLHAFTTLQIWRYCNTFCRVSHIFTRHRPEQVIYCIFLIYILF